MCRTSRAISGCLTTARTTAQETPRVACSLAEQWKHGKYVKAHAWLGARGR